MRKSTAQMVTPSKSESDRVLRTRVCSCRAAARPSLDTCMQSSPSLHALYIKANIEINTSLSEAEEFTTRSAIAGQAAPLHPHASHLLHTLCSPCAILHTRPHKPQWQQHQHHLPGVRHTLPSLGIADAIHARMCTLCTSCTRGRIAFRRISLARVPSQAFSNGPGLPFEIPRSRTALRRSRWRSCPRV